MNERNMKAVAMMMVLALVGSVTLAIGVPAGAANGRALTLSVAIALTNGTGTNITEIIGGGNVNITGTVTNSGDENGTGLVMKFFNDSNQLSASSAFNLSNASDPANATDAWFHVWTTPVVSADTNVTIMVSIHNATGELKNGTATITLKPVPPPPAPIRGRLDATPAYINLGMNTTILLEVGSLYAAGVNDSYLVNVTAPGGASYVAWYNFSAPGTVSMLFGNSSVGFMAVVDRVGTYSIRADYFDGVSYTEAATDKFLTTDLLLVDTEMAIGSNEYTDIHNCPVAVETQRGGEIIARGYVRYASTGEILNSTRVPSAIGNVTGTITGTEMTDQKPATQPLTYHQVNWFWRAPYFLTWNATIGVITFTVNAADGRGNHGTGVSPPAYQTLLSWKVIPAVLKVVPRLQNGSGQETVRFVPGDILTVSAKVTYEGHKAHNRQFVGPLNQTRGGIVYALLGYGPYDALTGQFNQSMANVTLTVDAATQEWKGTYPVTGTAPVRSDLQGVVIAKDGANPPNTGSAFLTGYSIQPPVVTPPPPPPVPPAAPVVTSPADGAKVNGTVRISGTTAGNVTKVQVRIGTGSWTDVAGNATWSYDWNTSAVADGAVSLRVRAYDGTTYSPEAVVSIHVANAKTTTTPPTKPVATSSGVDPMLLGLVAVVTLVVGLGIGMMIRGKSSKGGEEKEEE